MFGFQNVETFVPDQWLDDGDKVEVAGATFDVVHCPGHTGSCGFLSTRRQCCDGRRCYFSRVNWTYRFSKRRPSTTHQFNHEKTLAIGSRSYFCARPRTDLNIREERRSNPFVSDMALGQIS